MLTANLQILDEYDADKANNFDAFADVLGLWATQYPPEVSCTVARYADELFDVQAVRILLEGWHEAYKNNRKCQRDMFHSVADGVRKDAYPEDFKNLYENEQVAYNQALYELIVA